jgi:hypothetical protein
VTLITVNGPASAVAINTTSGNVTVNGAGGTPFLSNSKLTYTGGAKSTFPFGKCKITTFTLTPRIRAASSQFDTGARTLDGTLRTDSASSTSDTKANGEAGTGKTGYRGSESICAG